MPAAETRGKHLTTDATEINADELNLGGVPNVLSYTLAGNNKLADKVKFWKGKHENIVDELREMQELQNSGTIQKMNAQQLLQLKVSANEKVANKFIKDEKKLEKLQKELVNNPDKLKEMHDKYEDDKRNIEIVDKEVNKVLTEMSKSNLDIPEQKYFQEMLKLPPEELDKKLIEDAKKYGQTELQARRDLESHYAEGTEMAEHNKKRKAELEEANDISRNLMHRDVSYKQYLDDYKKSVELKAGNEDQLSKALIENLQKKCGSDQRTLDVLRSLKDKETDEIAIKAVENAIKLMTKTK